MNSRTVGILCLIVGTILMVVALVLGVNSL